MAWKCTLEDFGKPCIPDYELSGSGENSGVCSVWQFRKDNENPGFLLPEQVEDEFRRNDFFGNRRF